MVEEGQQKGPMKNQTLRLCLTGDGGVGKSTLVIAWTQRVFVEEYDPTIEDSYRKQIKDNDGEDWLLDVLDTAGPEEFSALRDQWYRDCALAIVCFSVTARTSWEQVPVYVSQLNRVKDADPAPFILVATKIDQRPTDRCEVSTEEGKALAKETKALAYLECSSMTFQGVDDIFSEALRLYIEKKADVGNNNTIKKKDCVLC